MNTKLCPFCAEEIKLLAIVCKHCGRELDSKKVKKANSELKEIINIAADRENDVIKDIKKSALLPSNYNPPAEIINTLYNKKVKKLKKGEWELVKEQTPLPTLNPYKVNPSILRKELFKYGKKAWEKGGFTPEGAIRWIAENGTSITSILFTKNPTEHSQIDEIARRFFGGYTKNYVKDDYKFRLKSYIKRIIKESKNKDEALLKAKTLLDSIPIEMRQSILDETIKHLEISDITGEEFDPPLDPFDPAFLTLLSDLSDIELEITNHILQTHKGIKYELFEHYDGTISHEELQTIIYERVRGDKRFGEGNIALLSFKIEGRLKDKNFFMPTNDFLKDLSRK